jgi:hypothetical protein
MLVKYFTLNGQDLQDLYLYHSKHFDTSPNQNIEALLLVVPE